MIQISTIPLEFVDKYNLKGKAHNGQIIAQITNGMYGLPQALQISHVSLVNHLETYG